MPFCPLSPTLPASKSANKSPRICYACSLSPSCRADARGVLLRGKLGRAHARFLTAKSLKRPTPQRRGKDLLSGICLKGRSTLVFRHAAIHLVAPGEDAALHVAHVFEACCFQDAAGARAAHAALAVDHDV